MNVSVIIPVLNESTSVASAVERAWLAGADDVVVCDGGSCDDTVAIASRQRCELIESRAGRAVQLNDGARASCGEVLLFLHVDNWLEPGAIEQVREKMRHENCLGGAFRQRIEALGAVYRLLERGNAARVRLLGLAYGDQGIFVRRDVFDRLGGFPEVPLMEDLRFMREFRKGGRPVLLPGPLHVSARRWQQHGVVRQTVRNWALLTAEKVGVAPSRLAKFYPPP